MEGFESLQRLYRQGLSEKRAALESDWRAIMSGAAPELHAQALRRQLHNLAGSGGAYGYDAMGETARQIEKRWVQWLATASARPEAIALCDELALLFATLLDELQSASLPQDEDEMVSGD